MKALIYWFIDNKVAANLLMIFIIAGGLLTLSSLKMEVFPDASPDMVIVTVVYPGFTPKEVEEGICIKIEEAIDGIEGIKRITSTSSEGVGTVQAELFQDADKKDVLNDIKSKVDAISTFPVDAEKPVIVDVEMPNAVVNLAVSGMADPVMLKRVTQQIRDELAALPDISRAEVGNAPPYEVSIEVSEDALRMYGLSFDDVVAAVRGDSLNLAGGTVKTRGGEIVLRSDKQAYVGAQFEEIVLLKSRDGTRIRLGDVATVHDAFKDVDQWSLLDGEPAYTITVFRMGEQSAPEVAQAVYEYVEKKRAELPAPLTLTLQKDWADLLEQRIDLLLENGRGGLILIFILLALFLRLKLAFWVAIGLPTALLGAVWLLPGLDTSINMLSLFGFIVVLGILVDDAIVVAENIYFYNKKGLSGPDAAKKGTLEVTKPVVLAILTTLAAFVPMLTLPGAMGKFARVIPIVVICALLFSLIESLLILPKHLSHMKSGEAPATRKRSRIPWAHAVSRISHMLGAGLDRLIDKVYKPVLHAALSWRYSTLAVGVAVVLLTMGLFGAGVVKFTFFPAIEGDEIIIALSMPPGTSVENTEAGLRQIEAAADSVRQKHEEREGCAIFKHVFVSVGAQPVVAANKEVQGGPDPSGSHLGEIFIELYTPDERNHVKAEDLMNEIRQTAGAIPGAREVKYQVDINQGEAPIGIRLCANDLGVLREAADTLKERLRGYNGVFDVSDDMPGGKREIRLFVTPEGEALGISQAELARQVRQAFYGDEAQRIQRGRDDVKVMVRYPREGRRALATLEEMRIRLPGGEEVPFSMVARAEEGRGPAEIHRADGYRSITVTADVDRVVANANEVVGVIKASVLPELVAGYRGLTWTFIGEQREQSETMGGLYSGSVLALLMIFSMLALAFNSFLQPLIVIIAIPFGMVGAVFGHWLLGHDLTMLSTVGLLAMAGVVVNDSMILIDFVNRAREKGASAWDAVREAGPRRFRPILLTSLTTFAGLTPLLMETSVQAQFLIPMAISLSFGVLFSTFVILLLVPAAYLTLEDFHKLRGSDQRKLFSDKGYMSKKGGKEALEGQF